MAAAVNDFARLNVDEAALRRGAEAGAAAAELVALSNGCICCSMAGAFEAAVFRLLQGADMGKVRRRTPRAA